MTDDHLQRRAETLASRVDALAEALRAAGASEEASAQLLSRASAAVLHALNLELLTSESLRAPQTEPPEASYCVVFDAAEEGIRPVGVVRAAA